MTVPIWCFGFPLHDQTVMAIPGPRVRLQAGFFAETYEPMFREFLCSPPIYISVDASKQVREAAVDMMLTRMVNLIRLRRRNELPDKRSIGFVESVQIH